MLVIRRLFGTGTNCIAPSGLPLLLCLFPGLAPWAFLSRPPAGLVSRQKLAKGPSGNKVCILARAPGGQMRGAATQAMPVCIVEERQQSRCPPAAAPLRAAARRPAGGVARSLHTAPAHRVCSSLAPCQRAWGPAAKCTPYFLTGPKGSRKNNARTLRPFG